MGCRSSFETFAYVIPYDKLALKDLTYKVLILILLVSSQRGQTVHSLDLQHLCVEEDKYIFDIDEHMKTSSQRNPNTRIETAQKFCIKMKRNYLLVMLGHINLSPGTQFAGGLRKSSTFVGWIPKCSPPIALGRPLFQKPVPKMSLFTRSWQGLAGNPQRLFINITISLLFKKTVWPLLSGH